MKTQHKLVIALAIVLALVVGYFLSRIIQPPPEYKILGRVEAGYITEEKVKLNIRMDTGAMTSSLSAHQIEIFKKGKKKWVRFVIEPERTGGKIYQFELPLKRMVKIRKRASEATDVTTVTEEDLFERRPVVEMHICLGDETRLIEMTLADRSNFAYPMLLGRRAMEDFRVLIDPLLVFTRKPVCDGMTSNEL